MDLVRARQIEKVIYVIRGQRVMLDADLAELYGVETKYLNRQVQRNLQRFPEDFAFKLTKEEWESLRCQIVTSKDGKGGRRYLPSVFTEGGIAMLSSVLNSESAILMNVIIIKTFIKLRSFLAMESEDKNEMREFKTETLEAFRVVFKRIDKLEEMVRPHLETKRRKIGLKDK